MVSKKFNFDYYIQRAEVLNEMARPVTHGLLTNIVLQGENAAQYAKIANEILTNRIKKGITGSGEQLIDSEGNPAPGITASPDDRYNKWVLMSLLAFTDDDGIRKIDMDENNLAEIYSVPAIEDMFSKYGDKAWNKFEKFLYKINSKSKVDYQAARLVFNYSVEDNVNYLKYGEKGAPLYKSAIALLVRKYPKVLFDEDYLNNYLFNKEQLANYMNGEEGRTIFGSTQSVLSAKSKLQKHGILDTSNDDNIPDEVLKNSIRDFDKKSTKILPILKKIHIAQAALNKRKKVEPTEETSTDSNTVENEFTLNYQNVMDLLDELNVVKKLTERVFDIKIDKFGVSSSGQPITYGNVKKIDKLMTLSDNLSMDRKLLSSIASLPRNTKNRTLIDDLKLEFEDFEETGLSKDEILEILKDWGSSKSEIIVKARPIFNYIYDQIEKKDTYIDSEFPGYSDKVLEQFLTTEEEYQDFADYYDLYMREREEKKDRTKQMYSKALRWMTVDEVAEIVQDESEFQQHLNDMDFTNDPNWLYEFRGKFMAFQNKMMEKYKKLQEIRKKQKKQYGDTETDMDIEDPEYAEVKDIDSPWADTRKALKKESYVMSYMTEQVSKDRFKPKGEFRDRGIRKLNYLEWLERNQ